MNRIAIFASGNGSNAEEIITHFKDHEDIKVVALLSNNPDAFALERAKKFGIRTFVFERKQFREKQEVLHWLTNKRVSHVVLAGFMWLIPHYLVQAYPDKIINLHPALLPKFGGKGMYGMHVHEAVKKAGETETGITIHLVNEKYDEGRIVFQARCAIEPQLTAQQIADKVHELEYRHYPQVIEDWIVGS